MFEDFLVWMVQSWCCQYFGALSQFIQNLFYLNRDIRLFFVMCKELWCFMLYWLFLYNIWNNFILFPGNIVQCLFLPQIATERSQCFLCSLHCHDPRFTSNNRKSKFHIHWVFMYLNFTYTEIVMYLNFTYTE